MVELINQSELLMPKNESLLSVFSNFSGTDIAINESDIYYHEFNDILNVSFAADVVTELPFRVETLINTSRDTIGK